MRSIWIIFLFIHCALVLAQTGIPHLPSSGGSIGAFIPDRWTALDTAFGDLNNDHRDDVVLVLQCRDTIMGDTAGMGKVLSPAPPRMLAILFATAAGYSLALQNDRFILRADVGGWFDPFEGVETKDETLLLYFYGGSGWRYSNTYTFRYGTNGFEIIGAEAVSYNSASGEGEGRSIDFLSHSMKVTTGNMTEQEKGNKTFQKDLPPWPLRTFDTFVRPFTWKIDADLTL